MVEPNRTKSAVPRPAVAQIKRAMRRLVSAAECESYDGTAARLRRFLEDASRTTELLEAAVAAVQALRDAGTIDGAEAACVLHVLFDISVSRFHQGDRALPRRAAEARFHFERGEAELAALILAKPGEHETRCRRGSRSLLDDKADQPPPVQDFPDEKKTAVFSERILAVAAAEDCREARLRLDALCADVSVEDAPSAVAAAQNLRALGAISEAEAAYLVDHFLGSVFGAACNADREWRRLVSAMGDMRHEAGLENGAPFPEGKEPPGWKSLWGQFDRRVNAIQAFCLRRYGEHELATMRVEQPEEYDELVHQWVMEKRPSMQTCL